ncbi:MAG TPA: hypothetical protein VNN72_22170 [Polyangiaceae bacterium]|nr:hypothetical protein [Polyangiaceae bacterium]
MAIATPFGIVALSHWVELERPAEWLRVLDEQDGSYTSLVRESGNLAIAAHRFARAKRRVLGGSDGIPTWREVLAAARLIAARVPHQAEVEMATLSAECSGLCISDLPPPRL